MIIRLNEFIARLQNVSYLKYALYSNEEILFITLYNSEDLEKYIIIDPLTTESHPAIIAALEANRK